MLSATVNGNNVNVTWRFPVTTEYANPAELLHGAAQALFGENVILGEMGSTSRSLSFSLSLPLSLYLFI